MRKDLVEILACPDDRSALTLSVETETGDEVIRGSLTCTQCGEVFPIEDKIPNLLPRAAARTPARSREGN